MTKRTAALLAALFLTLTGASCGGKRTVAKLDAEDTFARGMENFNRRKYVEAIDDFKEIIYNYSSTRIAAEASYYLGESYLLTKDYESAIDEYRHLTTDYASSPLAEKGLYRMAYAYFRMSPHYALDQAETGEKARSTLQLYFERYPQGGSRAEAEELMAKVNDKLAHKDYEAGMIYYKMKEYSSAKIYFQGVAGEFPGTQWAAKASIMLQTVEPLIKNKDKPGPGSNGQENRQP